MPGNETQPVATWKGFRDVVASLYEQRETKQQKRDESIQKATVSREATGKTDRQLCDEVHSHNPGSHLLFRGHRCASWKLETSLERAYPQREFSLRDVFHHVFLLQDQLCSAERLDFSEGDFCSEAGDISPWVSNAWTRPFIDGLKALRHMGVPSPLLDWSHSPFVAAFFAFLDCGPKQEEPIAVFHFQEHTGLINQYVCNSTSLNVFSPFGRSHDRQTRQQSAYTMCVKDRDTHGKSVRICDHEEYFHNVLSANRQYGRLVKFTVPASERKAAMKDLERMNITEASLFGGDDATARTLFRRALDWLDDQ